MEHSGREGGRGSGGTFGVECRDEQTKASGPNLASLLWCEHLTLAFSDCNVSA